MTHLDKDWIDSISSWGKEWMSDHIYRLKTKIFFLKCWKCFQHTHTQTRFNHDQIELHTVNKQEMNVMLVLDNYSLYNITDNDDDEMLLIHEQNVWNFDNVNLFGKLKKNFFFHFPVKKIKIKWKLWMIIIMAIIIIIIIS